MNNVAAPRSTKGSREKPNAYSRTNEAVSTNIKEKKITDLTIPAVSPLQRCNNQSVILASVAYAAKCAPAL